MFEPPRYMTVAQAAAQILEAIESRKIEGSTQLSCELVLLHFLLSLAGQPFHTYIMCEGAGPPD